jgi:hypothetical protein
MFLLPQIQPAVTCQFCQVTQRKNKRTIRERFSGNLHPAKLLLQIETSVSRTRGIMDAPAFDSKRFVRPVLLSTALFFAAVIVSLITITNPAHASGTVKSSVLFVGGGKGSGYDCSALTSVAQVQSCERAIHDKWLADDLNQYNGNSIYRNNYFPYDTSPLFCPAATVTDYGPSSTYADVFAVGYYNVVYSAGGFWIPIYYKYCDGP